MTAIKATIAAVALAVAGPAFAAEPVAAPAAAPGTVYRLSPDEIAQIDPKPLAQDPKLAYDPLFDRSLFAPGEAVRTDRRPHGEVGAFVGTGGARGIYGTTTVPVGENGSASFSFENSNYGDRRYRRR